jgi:peptidoglycan/LPS O-acetylase OafA/YrhL
MKINYKPHIDGLRAIGVISVIFYHLKISFFNFDLFSGGFLGVDVFFVISGYLITTIIINELNHSNSFSFVNFYLRRARRILPALYLVMLVSIPVALIFLRPAELVNYSNSILYTLIFLSNFFFYNSTTDYGAELSLEIPFLHTWTLSVEEQFYLLFPIFLFFVYKFFKEKLFIFLSIVAISSLLFAHWAHFDHPLFNFYFSFSRAWELLAGSLVAYIKLKKKREHHRFLKEVCPFAGIFSIFFSIFFFSTELTHPSFFTLFAVIGTCLVIFYTDKPSIVYKCLSINYMVFIGLISYSLYIWHYPVLSFVKIQEFGFDNLITKIVILMFVFFLSVLSYFFVEKIFRNKEIISTKVFIVNIFLITITFIILIMWVYKTNGLSSRFLVSGVNVDNYLYAKKAISHQNKIKNNNIFNTDNKKIKILIIGNSHAEDTMMLLKNTRYLLNNYEFALERIQVDNFYNKIKFKELSKNFLDADVLFFSTKWFDTDIAVLPKLIFNLKSYDKKIILSTNTPEFSVKKIKFKNINLTNISSYSEFIIRNKRIPTKDDLINLEKKYYHDYKSNNRIGKINTYLLEFANKNNIKILDKVDYICDVKNYFCDVLTDKNELIVYDHSHYSVEGTKYLAKKIKQLNWFQIN